MVENGKKNEKTSVTTKIFEKIIYEILLVNC